MKKILLLKDIDRKLSLKISDIDQQSKEKEKKKYLGEITDHLKQILNCIPLITSEEEYIWTNNTLLKWKSYLRNNLDYAYYYKIPDLKESLVPSKSRNSLDEKVDSKLIDLLDKQAANFDLNEKIPLILMMVKYLKRAKYSYFKLSAAFINAGINRVVLFRLLDGEFEGEWGFPSGYIEPETDEFENSSFKAEYEIKKYFNYPGEIFLSEDMFFTGSLTQGKPIWIKYSNIPHVQANVFEWDLYNENIIKHPKKDWVIFDYSEDKIEEEIEKLTSKAKINPLVYQVLDKYKDALFPVTFKNDIQAEIDKLTDSYDSSRKFGEEDTRKILRKVILKDV